METQPVLILVLVVLVAVLAGLLWHRIRSEKQQLAAIQRMNLDAFSEFLRTNSVDGNIAEVARKVSDLLQEALGCDLILFLRKKRQNLEVNYHYGLRDFNRDDYRIPASRAVLGFFAADFRPASLETLRDKLPDDYIDRLRKDGFSLCFPIFWRDNLYGVYFVRSTLETRSPSFHLLLAGLAQSLSAAYHIKWHESRYQMVREQLERVKAVSPSVAGENRMQSHLMKLVNHRSSQTLMPRLVESIRKDFGFQRIAYLYLPNGNAEPQIIAEGLPQALGAPDKAVVENLTRWIKNDEICPLTRLIKEQPGAREWTQSLRDSGLEFLTTFPACRGRIGLLAFSSGKAGMIGREQFDTLKTHVRDLITNVETYERIEEMSQTDALTGLANQRYFRRRLDEETQRAKRYKRQLALIFFDLDGLKQTNDTYGHLAGDAIIRHMGRILRNHIRSIDIIARYGGDEFCIIMPEADKTTCLRFMERLKNEVARTPFVVTGVDAPLSSTVSLGGAVFPDHADSPHQLIFAADMALLRAKEQGRNKSVLYDEAGATQT